MIRAIAFDLWETLITDTPEQSRKQERLRLTRLEQILAARGLGATAERIEHAYRTLWQRCHELYWSADVDVPCRRQIEHFVEELRLDVDADTLDALEDAYARAAVEVLPSLVDGAPEVLAELKARGYRLRLILKTRRPPRPPPRARPRAARRPRGARARAAPRRDGLLQRARRLQATGVDLRRAARGPRRRLRGDAVRRRQPLRRRPRRPTRRHARRALLPARARHGGGAARRAWAGD